jgi:hypothetical protein
MLYGFTLTGRLRGGAALRPAWSRWARIVLALAAATFGYSAIDEQVASGRVWLVGLSLVGIAAVGLEVRRRRVHGESWSRRSSLALIAVSIAFAVGGLQAALFSLQ